MWRSPRFFEGADPFARWQGLATEISDVFTLVMLGGLAFLAVDAALPPQDLPWEPLSVSQPIGLATGAKLEKVGASPSACRGALSEGGLSFADQPDRQDGEFCAIRDALTLTGEGAGLRPRGAVMACEQALAYTVWQRQVVQPAAIELLGSPVRSIEHYGTYACRRRYAQQDQAPSEHAYANALDVAAFRLEDGRTVSVETHWQAPGPERVFLERVRTGACRVFNGVLSPDYNAAHANHLHLDMGQHAICS